MGKDNSYEPSQPHSYFCTIEEVREMAQYLNARIGYHSWSHRSVKGLPREDVIRDMRPPDWLLPHERELYAWPYGDFTADSIEVAKELGYKEAWAVHWGDGSAYQQRRAQVGW